MTSLNEIWYDAKDVCQKVSCRQLVQDEFSVIISGNQSVAYWRNGDNMTAILYNDNDGTCHDYVKDAHYNSVQLYQLIHNVDFPAAVNYLGDRYTPNMRLAAPFGKKHQQQQTQTATNTPSFLQMAKDAQNGENNETFTASGVNVSLTTQTTTFGQSDVKTLAAQLAQSAKPSILPAPPKNKLEELFAQGFKIVKEYKYLTVDGKHIYSVLRLENGDKKEFIQRAADGSFFVKDLEKLLYNLPAVAASQKIYVCEGEKCADCLIERGFCATTTSGGAGKGRWQADFNKYFADKDVVILTDGDEKGKEYGLLLASEISTTAKTIKLITPCNQPKKDIADFFYTDNHTPQDLIDLENDTPFYHIPKIGEVTDNMIAVAKQKNALPFANYTERRENGKTIYEPIQPLDLLNDFFAMFLNFPCLLGKDMLFDHDRESKEIIELDKPQKLFAWISKKSKKNYLWKSGNGFVDKQEFYSLVMQSAHRFELISSTPDFPTNPATYYTFSTLPKPSKTHEYFNKLVDFFNPDGAHGRELIKAIFLSPMYYRTSATKPSWIIDSKYGKGVGKTTVYDLISKLYMCSPIQVHRESFKNSDELDKRLVSNTGRKSKIFAIDNIEGRFSNEILAQYITANTLSGRAPYSAGEDSRPNNLTYIITCNSAEINGDLTSRSYFLFLKKFDNENHRWKEEVEEYIEKYRWFIFADMLDILQNHKPFENCKCFTRHRLFEVEVMQAVCDNQTAFEEMMNEIVESATVANTDSEIAQEIVSIIINKLADMRIIPQENCVWIPSSVLKRWLDEESIKKTTASIRQLAIDGHTKNIDAMLDRFPKSSTKTQTRGIMWIGEKANTATAFVLYLNGKNIGINAPEKYKG